MFTIVATNLLRRPARTLFTASGIAVGIAMIVALLSFTRGLQQTAAGFVHLGGSGLGVFQANVSDPTASVLPESLVPRLAAHPDVSRATPLLLMVEAVKGSDSAIVFGAEPNGFFTQSLVILSGGRPGSSREILVGDRLAAQLHLRPERRSRSRAAHSGSRASTTRASSSRTAARCSSSPKRSGWRAAR